MSCLGLHKGLAPMVPALANGTQGLMSLGRMRGALGRRERDRIRHTLGDPTQAPLMGQRLAATCLR